VVIAVVIAAADGIGGELQLPENEYDRDNANEKLDDSNC
jgi:hypothetical protein